MRSNLMSNMDGYKFWRDFEFEYILDVNGLIGSLISIEGYKQAAFNLVLPPEWREQLDRLNRVRAVYARLLLKGIPYRKRRLTIRLESLIKKES